MTDTGKGLDKKEILFVDDEADVLRGLRRSLRTYRDQWSLRFVEGGAEALNAMKEKPADIVVTDMRMPDVDGATLLTTLADEWPFTARIVLSGQADSLAVKKVVGCSHQFLAKPCDTEKLIAVLEQVSGGLQSEVESRILAIQALPTPRATVLALQDALNHHGDDATKAARIIGDDLSLSAKLLQLSNSAYFGTGNATLLPGDAVRTLGVDLLRTLCSEAATGVFVEQLPEATPLCEEARFVTELSRQLAHLADQAIETAPDRIKHPVLFRQVCKFLPLGRLLGCLTGAKPEFDTKLSGFFMDLWGLPQSLREASALVWAKPNTDQQDGEEETQEEAQPLATNLANVNVMDIADLLSEQGI